METEYIKGYRDGFKDGFQVGSVSGEILRIAETNSAPNSPKSPSVEKPVEIQDYESTNGVVAKGYPYSHNGNNSITHSDSFHKNCEQKGCGAVSKGGSLICGKTRVVWNPISCEGDYIWLCPKCKENAPNQSQQDSIGEGYIPQSPKQGQTADNIHIEIKKEIEKDYD